MAKKSEPLSEQVRRAIDESGLTRYRIAKDTGLGQSAMSRFMSGERGLSMDALDRIGEYLHLRIVAGPKPPGGKKE